MNTRMWDNPIIKGNIEKLRAYFTAKSDSGVIQKPVIQDRFQSKSECEFLKIPEMPLTESGEADRRRLSAINARRIAGEKAKPRTEVERRIASIWSEILGIEQVGIYDNFFELGGHSLLATQVASRLRDAFSVELPLIDRKSVV